MNRSIILVSCSREGSTRLPKKLIKPFCDTTLFDIHMDKLEKLQSNNVFSDIIVAVSESDKTLWDKAHSYNIKVQPRDKYSATTATDMSDIFHFMKEYKHRYMMWLNSSSPFIKVDTILKVINLFDSYYMESLHMVKKKNNWFWKDDKPINMDSIHTQNITPLYESLHSLHIYNRKYMLENNFPWDFTCNNPYLYKVEDSLEFFDVDTKEDFKIAEYIWKTKVL